MALDAATIRELLKQLEADRKAYLVNHERTLELLSQALPKSPRPSFSLPSAIPAHVRASGVDHDSEKKSSTFTGDDDEDSDDDESLFVQQTLPAEAHSDEDLCNHLLSHPWDEDAHTILDGLPRRKAFFNPQDLFRATQANHSATHHQVYEIGTDGAPLQYRAPISQEPCSKDQAIWRDLTNINTGATKTRPAVGRIAIIYEPSPVAFAAVHCAMRDHFDMDEIFRMFVDPSNQTKIHMNAFSEDHRRQRSIVVSLRYITIRAPDRKPMSWQFSSEAYDEGSSTHIPISHCSSVVALSLNGEPIASIKNRARRAKTTTGKVYDPFAPWRVLSIQAFPDWKSTLAYHDGSKHFVNGPEAFLITLLAEYRDAAKRLAEVNRQIAKLVAPPPTFMFNSQVRDKLLFEDDSYTYSRRYFWANQTLAIANDHIEAMINAFRDTFTDDVWSGHHKILWPGKEDVSARYAHFRRRMAGVRKDFEQAIAELEKIHEFNQREQKDIKSMRDQLFSGTSVLESRKSVQQTAITVQQGHNIKLLTLVSIFFLPLTFVTSIFGMTNMDPNANFVNFGIVTACICLPSYLLIGSLNTTKGMDFWRRKASQLWHHAALGIFFICRPFSKRSTEPPMQSPKPHEDEKERQRQPSMVPHRSNSTERAIAIRAGLRQPTLTNFERAHQRTEKPLISSPVSLHSESTIRFHHTTSFEARHGVSIQKAATLPNLNEPPPWTQPAPAVASPERIPARNGRSSFEEVVHHGFLRRMSDRFERLSPKKSDFV